MISVDTNATVVARAFMTRRGRMTTALRRGVKRWTALVAAAAAKNLSGSGGSAPGSYPVPVRTGHLRRSGQHKTKGLAGIVFFPLTGRTGAAYAAKIHRDRPFLADAAESVDGQAVVRSEMLRIL